MATMMMMMVTVEVFIEGMVRIDVRVNMSKRFRRSPGIDQQQATNQFFEIAAGQLSIQILSKGPKVCTSSDRGGIELYLRVCW